VIPQMIPWFDELEVQAMAEYMNSGNFLTEFTQTHKFEDLLAEVCGSKHVIVVSNGTVSLWMMLQALGIGPGDSVIVPNYTMIATANAVKAAGAEVIFCDVEIETLCLDFEDIKLKIRTNTKAIFFVSANGRSPTYNIQDLKTFCDNNSVVLLEDAAQSLGSFYPNGKHIGTVGLMGSLSFSVPKIITTGQGGAILTDDDNLAKSLRKLKDFGRSSGGNDIHDTFGLNFKFTDLQATIGIVQVGKLQNRIELKRSMYQSYREHLNSVIEINFFDHDLSYTTPWFVDCLVRKRSELVKHLADNKISTRLMYPPVSKQKAFNAEGNHPVSQKIGAEGLWLPSFTQISKDQITRICMLIKDFYQKA